MSRQAKRSAAVARLITASALALGGLDCGPAYADTPANAVGPPAAASLAPGGQPRAIAGYAIVSGAHPESADPFQSLTIVCPDRLKVFGAGFSAVVRVAGQTKDGRPVYREEGLNDIRSVPESQGAGWLIEGVSPDAASTKQPWSLVARVVCVRIAG